jgi:CBS domain containing-hemolysin-like protein
VTLLAAAAGETLHRGLNVPALLIGLALLVTNAFFVAAEISLLAARRVRIEELAESGDKQALRALKALQELSITFSGAQLGITMCSLGLGAIAEPAVAGLLAMWLEPLGWSDGTLGGVSFGLALTIVVFLHMVLGEMVPKNLALAGAETLALRVSRLFGWYVTALRPLIVLLNSAANRLVRLTGVEPIAEIGLVHTPDELHFALRESRRHGQLEAPDARVLTAALRLKEIDAEDAMTPRVDLITIPQHATPGDILEVAARTGFTRLPVTGEDLDNIVGVVHIKDLLIAEPHELRDRTAHDWLRKLDAVPESRDLEQLLRGMQKNRAHVALVVDEYGGTAGLLTLEDVLEELVGEIADEFDGEDRSAKPSDGAWVVPGTFRRDELHRLTDLVLPEGQAETVSGVLTEMLGRLVRRGDEVDVEGWTVRVLTVEGRRAGQVEVVAPVEPDADADPDAS